MTQQVFGNLSSPLQGQILIDEVLEPFRDSVLSNHAGNSRPSYAQPKTIWVNDTTTPWVVNMFDGVDDVPIGTLDATTHLFTPYIADNTLPTAAIEQIDGNSLLANGSNSAASPSAFSLAANRIMARLGGNLIGATISQLLDLVSSTTNHILLRGASTWGSMLTTAYGQGFLSLSNITAGRTYLGLGTAAPLNAGVAAGNVVQLNGSAQLPAVDGSLLTGLTSTPDMYTGTSSNNTSYPVGSYILLFNGSASNRNSTVVPRLSTESTYFLNSGSETIVAGVWRSRGRPTSDGILVQRVS